jgi:hypothetical protein
LCCRASNRTNNRTDLHSNDRTLLLWSINSHKTILNTSPTGAIVRGDRLLHLLHPHGTREPRFYLNPTGFVAQTWIFQTNKIWAMFDPTSLLQST